MPRTAAELFKEANDLVRRADVKIIIFATMLIVTGLNMEYRFSGIGKRPDAEKSDKASSVERRDKPSEPASAPPRIIADPGLPAVALEAPEATGRPIVSDQGLAVETVLAPEDAPLSLLPPSFEAHQSLEPGQTLSPSEQKLLRSFGISVGKTRPEVRKGCGGTAEARKEGDRSGLVAGVDDCIRLYFWQQQAVREMQRFREGGGARDLRFNANRGNASRDYIEKRYIGREQVYRVVEAYQRTTHSAFSRIYKEIASIVDFEIQKDIKIPVAFAFAPVFWLGLLSVFLLQVHTWRREFWQLVTAASERATSGEKPMDVERMFYDTPLWLAPAPAGNTGAIHGRNWDWLAARADDRRNALVVSFVAATLVSLFVLRMGWIGSTLGAFVASDGQPGMKWVGHVAALSTQATAGLALGLLAWMLWGAGGGVAETQFRSDRRWFIGLTAGLAVAAGQVAMMTETVWFWRRPRFRHRPLRRRDFSFSGLAEGFHRHARTGVLYYVSAKGIIAQAPEALKAKHLKPIALRDAVLGVRADGKAPKSGDVQRAAIGLWVRGSASEAIDLLFGYAQTIQAQAQAQAQSSASGETASRRALSVLELAAGLAIREKLQPRLEAIIAWLTAHTAASAPGGRFQKRLAQRLNDWRDADRAAWRAQRWSDRKPLYWMGEQYSQTKVLR